MNDRGRAGVEAVAAAARALIAALGRAAVIRQPGAPAIAALIERDLARLEATTIDGDDDAIGLALIFPSLDARAADHAGGVDFDGDPELNPPYLALVNARIAARALLRST
jgi:hypothetical protein